uniref:Uncharacterized protein n=1 Tax=Lactuca sativa TaxID=4236 RepID=A0A9R1UVE1_LACSA|nr:hypothetical protein LSAT_V11C700350080 [Lactuca sativa]
MHEIIKCGIQEHNLMELHIRVIEDCGGVGEVRYIPLNKRYCTCVFLTNNYFIVIYPTYVRDVVSPIEEDFKICRAMVGFLEKFKVKTNIISTSTKPTTRCFL